jgi:hypothetical protein
MSREDLITPIVVLTTSLLVYGATRKFTRRKASLRLAAARFFECIGLTLVFFAVNVGTIVTLSFLIRTSGLGFVPFYVAHDVFLLILSAAQALFFSLWWRGD